MFTVTFFGRLRERAGHGEQRALCSGVVVVGDHRILEQVGADVQHAAVAGLLESGQRLLDDGDRLG